MVVKNDFPVYAGPIDLRRAMTESDNTVYAQLTQAVHPEPSSTPRKLGITSPLDPSLPIGLGGLRVGVTPLEMAHAYSTIATRGKRMGGSVLFHTRTPAMTRRPHPISIERIDFPGGHKDLNRPTRSAWCPRPTR